MANAEIMFTNCKFSIGSVSPFPHHHTTLSLVQFQYDDAPTLKTFMHGHSGMMTFLHLKVYNGKFSVGSVFQIFYRFSFPHHVRPGFDIYAWLWLKHLCVMTFLYFMFKSA